MSAAVDDRHRLQERLSEQSGLLGWKVAATARPTGRYTVAGCLTPALSSATISTPRVPTSRTRMVRPDSMPSCLPAHQAGQVMGSMMVGWSFASLGEGHALPPNDAYPMHRGV